MRWAFDQSSWVQAGALFRRRTAALLLVLAAHVLLVVMLLRLTPPTPPSGPVVTPFQLLPDRQERAPKAAEPKRAEQKSARQPAAPPPPPAAELPYKLDIIELTREEFAAANIAKLPSQDRTASAETAEASAAETAATGPNGERLYNAEWYREPTQAELAYYLPGGGARYGWAMIACQTVADYRVDNCIELGQSPAGSGLAAAIRQAAWQFRVLPPRIGGRPLVGAWVSIRIDFTRVPAK